MGSPKSEQGRFEWEGPQHEVTLTEGFWLGETACTQALWKEVMGTNPSRFQSLDRPVEQVTWDECGEFLRRLEERLPAFAGRLPTEAEWEYACRAGTETSTYAGENHAPLLHSIAWYEHNSGQGYELEVGEDSSAWPGKQVDDTRAGTHPVGRKVPNPWSLYDMLGNVFEWCEDAWDGTGYEPGRATDPLGQVGSRRVVRGGSWASRARLLRAAFRTARPPEARDGGVGFRLARGPERGAR